MPINGCHLHVTCQLLLHLWAVGVSNQVITTKLSKATMGFLVSAMWLVAITSIKHLAWNLTSLTTLSLGHCVPCVCSLFNPYSPGAFKLYWLLCSWSCSFTPASPVVLVAENGTGWSKKYVGCTCKYIHTFFYLVSVQMACHHSLATS